MARSTTTSQASSCHLKRQKMNFMKTWILSTWIYKGLFHKNRFCLRVPICEGFRFMPPSWFLRFWTDQACLGGISRGLRVWRQLREIPGGYCGGQWPQPVRRGQPWPNGAYPRAEGLPDQRWFRGGEDLKQSLGDEPELDVSMIGRDLSPNGVAVFIRFVVQILVATHAP